MKFFTDKSNYTHKGSFYGIPVYLNLSDDTPIIEGTNKIFDWAFTFMVYFHNTIIEFCAQGLAYLLNKPYEAGFAFWITGELKK